MKHINKIINKYKNKKLLNIGPRGLTFLFFIFKKNLKRLKVTPKKLEMSCWYVETVFTKK